MLNIEKYEKKLRKCGTYFALTNEGKLVNCEGLCCRNCAFNGKCAQGRMEWLLKEYKEPLLTSKEKEYLKNVIKPFGDYAAYVIKFATSKLDFLSIYISVNENKVCSFEIPLMYDLESMFKNIEYDKEYTLEELGL